MVQVSDDETINCNAVSSPISKLIQDKTFTIADSFEELTRMVQVSDDETINCNAVSSPISKLIQDKTFTIADSSEELT